MVTNNNNVSDAISNKNKWFYYVIPLVIIVIYSYLQVSHFLNIPEPRLYPDSHRYLQDTSAVDQKLVPKFGVTPLFVPFIYKLMGNNAEVITYFQVAFSIISWVFLAYVISRSLKSTWMTPFVFIIILGISLSSAVSLWNGVILSESLTLSIFACFIGSWMLIIEKLSLRRFLLLIILSLMFALIRTANVYLLLMLGLILAVASIIAMHSIQRRYYLAISILFIVISLISNVSASVGKQWSGYFMDVLATRILPDQERRAFFESYGMPVDDKVMDLEGKWSHEGGWAYFTDPELEHFREWLFSRGKSTYIRFLLTHPRFLITGPFQDFKRMLYGHKLELYAPEGYTRPLKGTILDGLFIWSMFPVYIFIAGIMVGVSLIFACSGKSTVSWLPIIMILLVYPLVALVWHADSHELERHVLPVSVQSRVAFFLMIIFIVDVACFEHCSSMIQNIKKRLPWRMKSS